MTESTREVAIYVQEGLGNQLFQYAFARAFAERKNATLKLDLRHFADSRNRPFQLDLFNVRYEAFDKADRIRLALNNSPKLRTLRPLLNVARSQLYTLVVDAQQGFDPDVLKVRGRRIHFNGFWQCEKYFSDYADLIRKEFTLKSPPSEQNTAVLNSIRSVTSVALHVRRGDYLNMKAFGVLNGESGDNYYKAAVAEMRRRVPGAHFFVFSDEPQWAADNLPFAEPKTVISHNGGAASYEDLRLMSQCNHLIIANSSFSWWSAWLATSPDKIVIAPKTWFTDGRGTGRDIAPESWIRI